jgi:hypothetical protein
MANVRVFATLYYRQVAGEICNSVGPKLMFNHHYWQVCGNMGALPLPLFINGLASLLPRRLKAGPCIQRILIQIAVASQLVPHCREVKLTP